MLSQALESFPKQVCVINFKPYKSQEDALVDKLLSVIDGLSNQAAKVQLLDLLLARLDKDQIKQALKILLPLEISYEKGLTLIKYLFYLREPNSLIVIKEILDCISKITNNSGDQSDLIAKLIEALALKKDKSGWLGYFIQIAEKLMIII